MATSSGESLLSGSATRAASDVGTRRPPQHTMLLAALVGTGSQLTVLSVLVILITMAGAGPGLENAQPFDQSGSRFALGGAEHCRSGMTNAH